MKKLVIPAEVSELTRLNEAINEELMGRGCSKRMQFQVSLAAEEIFTNIASYAYGPVEGNAEVLIDVSGDPPELSISFADRGAPFNPLDCPEADTSLGADEREIGGLGILLVKQWIKWNTSTRTVKTSLPSPRDSEERETPHEY